MISPTREQQAIISHPVEPLRVEAGAGTGKTTTLALRVASLLAAGRLEPAEVLGLTFTNKAAEELAERIGTLARDSLAPGEGVEVDTYHGFAYQVVQEFGPLAGMERSVKVITPTFARQLLFEIVQDTPYQNLDSTYPGGIVAKAVKLSADLGDNLLTADDLGRGQSRELLGPARADLLALLASYDRMKATNDLVDFADLVRIAHQLAAGSEEVACQIRSRYRVVLLDEYQDTNPAQRALLQAIFGPGSAVTAVGDSDQTIYEWRGASLDNFASFPSHFPDEAGRPAPTLELSINRRSAKLILDVANAISAKLDRSRNKRLQPMNDPPPGTVFVSWHRTAVDEANALAREIGRLRAEEGLAYRDMAILCRKNKDIGLIRDALEDHGIPAEVANLGGLLAVPEVVEIRAWLRLLANPADDVALARILTGSRMRLGLADLRVLSEWAADRDSLSDTDDDRGGPGVGLVEALDHLAELPLPLETAGTIRQFHELFRDLLASAQGTSLVELTRQILSLTGMWPEIEAMPEAARLSARLNLYRFLDLTEEWSPLDDHPSLEAFLAYLVLIDEEQAEESDGARLSTEDAVSLLTVHRAKGLEWEVVFLPALYDKNFPAQSRGFDDPFRKPEILPYEYRLDRDSLPLLTAQMSAGRRQDLLRDRHDLQEWRIAYVAATRARRYLYASGAHWVGAPHPLLHPVAPSSLFELIESVPDVEILEMIEGAGVRPQRLRIQHQSDAPDPLFEDGWPAALRQGAEDPGLFEVTAAGIGIRNAFREKKQAFSQMVLSIAVPQADEAHSPMRTSVTGLVTYATCPKRFFWAEVDRLPRRVGPAAARGVEVHRKIELHNLGVVPLGDVGNDRYDVGPGESEPSFDSAYEVYRGSRFARTRPLFVEAPFDIRLNDRLWVRGRIDAIYQQEPGDWEVVDFKTGRVTHSPSAVVQLQAYAIAAKDAGFAPEPPHRLRATFAYLGRGLTEQIHEVDARWERQARAAVGDIGDAILEQRWDPRPSSACGSCDFLNFCKEGKEWVDRQGP